jgi:hypothetical protein
VLVVGACRRSPGREFPEEVGGGDAAVHEEVAAGDERTVGTQLVGWCGGQGRVLLGGERAEAVAGLRCDDDSGSARRDDVPELFQD